jgi:carboxypeptidase Taq
MSSDKWTKFTARMRELKHLESVGLLLGWDEQTMMPTRGAQGRAAVMGTLASIEHERLTDERYGDLIAALADEPLEEEHRAMVELAGRQRDIAVKLPARLVRELAEAASLSQAAWQEARSLDDFSIFQPHLERVLELKAEQAEALGYAEEPYDAHLDLFERDATVSRLRPMFESVSAGIKPVLEGIMGSDGGGVRLPAGPYEPQEVFRYCGDLLQRLGYGMDSGRLDLSAHPFTCGVGPGDVRITTRVDPNDPKEAILATLHEMGHAFYHLGLPEHWVETSIGSSASFGVDESQSRLWENHVGRSLAFWEGELPRAQAVLGPWSDQTPQDIFRAVNLVEPSLIRVKADEVTYPLHIAVRFELELAICRGDLKASDLPDAWSQTMQRYLGVTPQSDAEGVLQDVHWSAGYLGYFPTYLIGSVYSAALFEAATKDLGGSSEVNSLLREGRFQPLLDWLRQKVHSLGASKRPGEVIAGATGSSAAGIDTGPYLSYIRKKYSELYSL